MINLPALTGGLFWDTSQLYTAGVLKAVAGIPGDYNHNVIVDAADYTARRDSLGSTTNLAAAFNGNGVIDAGDLTVWQMHFGAHAGSDAGGAVPTSEPTSAMTLLVGIAILRIRQQFLAP